MCGEGSGSVWWMFYIDVVGGRCGGFGDVRVVNERRRGVVVCLAGW